MLLIFKTIYGFFILFGRSIFARPANKGCFNAICCSSMGISFGKKLRECRGGKGLSQSELAKKLGAHHSIIGRYERDEVKPTIDVVKKIAVALDTTVGYLLGENRDSSILKDPAMLKRLNDIASFPEDDRMHILYTLDALIKNVKMKAL
jgi:transcriptional regulator with XRE-family HTH domain